MSFFLNFVPYEFINFSVIILRTENQVVQKLTQLQYSIKFPVSCTYYLHLNLKKELILL